MANDTFPGIARKLLLRCPSAPLTLAQDWVRDSFRDVVEYRRWSWLWKYGTVNIPAVYNTGTAAVTFGDATITLTGCVTDSSWVGRQFRIAGNSAILTIASITNATTFELDANTPWPGSTASGLSYSIYQAYYFMPSDFHAFISIGIPNQTRKVAHLNVSKADLDRIDFARSSTGTPPRVIVPFDYYNGLPRWEFWPHQMVQSYATMTYEARPIDPFDPGATVPHLLPSDLILERALMYCARWPGPARETPNPYYSEPLYEFHRGNYEKRLGLVIKQDNEHMLQDLTYQNSGSGFGSASFAQSHDMGWYGG